MPAGKRKGHRYDYSKDWVLPKELEHQRYRPRKPRQFYTTVARALSGITLNIDGLLISLAEVIQNEATEQARREKYRTLHRTVKMPPAAIRKSLNTKAAKKARAANLEKANQALRELKNDSDARDSAL